ncbi:hypothetical protein ASD21_07175 [Caulobacter sp. Root1455]|uniref:hypothetical protein n=1 Tax=Caulobacter sp. Root1455 TaxID=1736465 RepID=UPI000700C29F|nr:hypothetical protein [Caulobacter sp. Root1455]KQY95140.1 hypothetical protein ASD21_07175 [Caulobacter sp. Root1455]
MAEVPVMALDAEAQKVEVLGRRLQFIQSDLNHRSVSAPAADAGLTTQPRATFHPAKTMREHMADA